MNFRLLLATTIFAIASSALADEKTVKFPLTDMSAWGKNFGAWKVVEEAKMDEANPKKLVMKAGGGTLVNGEAGRTSNIFSAIHHGDLQVRVEFMVPKGSNSGVYFQGRYEIQILDSWGKKKVGFGDCGGIYQRWENRRGFEGHGPRENASLPPGEWQSFEVTFRAPRFDADGKKTANAVFVKVVHNGKVVHENVEVTGPTRGAGFRDEQSLGPLMLQGDHGPVAYRNLKLTGVVTTPSDEPAKTPLRWLSLGHGKMPTSFVGPATAVVFENQSSQPVKLYWLSYQGELTGYGELAPGATRRQNTFAGNVWVAKDAKDKPLGYVVAKALVSRAIIPEGK
jgi:hypothetical protein